MNEMEQPMYEGDSPSTPQQPEGVPKFRDRSEVEELALKTPGSWVPLRDSQWKGEGRIFVNSWRLAHNRECGHHVLMIMQEIFPNDTFFLAYLSTTEVFGSAETHARLYDLMFNRIYEHVLQLVCFTCDIEDDERSQFERTITLVDLLAIFVRIIEQEFNNEFMQALLGKLHGLIAERLPSEKWLPSIAEFTEAISQASGDSLQPNSKSSYNMPQTTKPEDSYTPIEQMPRQKRDGKI